MSALSEAMGKVHLGDCVAGMNSLPRGSVDLVFADPPFNIGYEYDIYEDRKGVEEYLDWSRTWMTAVFGVLKPTGTFWLAIGDEYAAELKLVAQQVGFTCRSWVIWYYTFGVNCRQKFSRSHAHLFYFVKDRQNFVFNSEELENRIPSARQLVYADSRANPSGRLPDDTWVLRPQDLADCFTTAEDTWYLPRVAGTFKERAGFHGCQMPEQLLGRIIRLCSNRGDVVLDPFSGSATTVAVAKKLGRKHIAFDLSKEYVERGNARLDSVRLGDRLEGSAEPTVSAPPTPRDKQGARNKRRAEESAQTGSLDDLSMKQLKTFREGLLEAFQRTYDGFSLDRMVADPGANQRFASACREIGLPGEPRTWNWSLFRMRKAGLLARFPTLERTEFSWGHCEQYLFASEIAWKQLIDSGCASLDQIICDPALAAEFDQIAARWAPGFTPLEYRWAAIKLRKSAKQVRARANLLTDARFSGDVAIRDARKKLPQQPGIYVVLAGETRDPIYAGEAGNLRQRVQSQFGADKRELWEVYSRSPVAQFFATSCSCTDRLAYQRRAIVRHQPALNLNDQKIA